MPFCVFVNLIWTVITWPAFMWKTTVWVASNTIGIKSRRQSEFWLMSQSELAVFTLAKAWLFPLRRRLVKTTAVTSIARSLVSVQRRDLVCHRFHEICECVSWGNFGSRNLVIYYNWFLYKFLTTKGVNQTPIRVSCTNNKATDREIHSTIIMGW